MKKLICLVLGHRPLRNYGMLGEGGVIRIGSPEGGLFKVEACARCRVLYWTWKKPEENNMPDEKLKCLDCGNDWILTEGERNHYESKELHLPKRCKACRDIRRQNRPKQDQQVG